MQINFYKNELAFIIIVFIQTDNSFFKKKVNLLFNLIL